MNFEKNGQPQNDKNRERVDDQNIDQNAEDDVKLTALALGEISDPDEANRLKALIEQDDDRRKEYESTAHLASMIRDSVENDLPLAPGSIHDVVVAALSKRASGAQSVDVSTSDEPSSAQPTPQKKVAAQSSQSWWSANGRMVSYVSALSVLGIAIAMTLYMQDWNGQPENVARHDASSSEDESRKTDEMNVLSNGGVEDGGRFRYMEDASSVKRMRGGTEAKISGQVPVGNESLEFGSGALKEADKYEGLQIKKGASRDSLDDMRLDETQKVELDGKAIRPSALNSTTRNFNIETARENNLKSEPKNQPKGNDANFFNPPSTKLEMSIAKNPSATKPGKMGLDRSNSDSGIRRSGDASRGKPNTAKSFKKSAPPNAPAFGGGGQGGGGAGGGLGGGGFGSGQNSARGAGAAGRSVGRSGGLPGDAGGNPNRYSRSTNDGVQKSAAPALGMAQPKAGGGSRGVRGGIEKADSDQSIKQAIGGRMKSTESAKGKKQSGQGERLQGQPMRSGNRAESENNSSSNGLSSGYGIKPRLRLADSKQKDASKAPSSRPKSRSGIDKFGDSDLKRVDGNLGADFRQKEELRKYKKDIKSIKTELEQAKPLQQNSANGSRWEGKLPKKAAPGGSTGRAASGGADPSGASPNDTKSGGAQPKQTAKAGFKSGDNPGQASGAELAPAEKLTPKSGVLGGEALKKGFADPKKGQDKSASNARSAETKTDKAKALEMRELPLNEKQSVAEKKRKLAKDNPAAGAVDETLEEEKAETDDQKANLQKKLVERKIAEKKLAEEMEDAESEDLLERDFEILQIDPFLENDFIQPIGTNAQSTFSADTDTVSFTNVRQMLRNGVFPHPEQVRIEEMINYFDFKYEQPKAKEKFSVNMELASSPWNPGNKILKIGLQAREVSNADRPPSNLVFLVDVSGSMREKNKLPLLQKGLKKMVGKLREDDYVSIVTYANQIKVPLQPTNGTKKDKIISVIDSLKAAGGTNGGEGLQQAYRLAEENLYKDGTNRIVLGTDGDFNLGIKNDVELGMLVKRKADSGVYLTVCGFGTDNFKDQKMQTMSQNGNGKVYYIDSEAEAQRVFADEISGSLVTIAKDVKLQLLFNPRTVQSYRLIGYENRMLTAQDFDNNKKDAGEINDGDSVTALYEIVPGDGDFTFPTTASTPKPIDLKYQLVQKESIELTKVAASNDLAALRIRFKAPNASVDSESEEREFVVKNSNTKFNRASKEFQLSTAVAGLGMMLRGSKHRGVLNFENLKEFGQTVLADRPTAFAGKKDTSGEKELNEDPVKLRKRRAQRQEVLELINRAADLYERRKR